MTDAWAGTSWQITAVGDQPITGEATISFDDEGRVAGRAVVNRFFGTYRVEDGTVTMGPLGSTMMAGPPEAMAEEQLVLHAFEGPMTVVEDTEETDGTDTTEGAVVLQGPSTTVRLTPATPEIEV